MVATLEKQQDDPSLRYRRYSDAPLTPLQNKLTLPLPALAPSPVGAEGPVTPEVGVALTSFERAL